MKTAVILTGNIRTWEQSIDAIVAAFVDYDCDFFVSTYDLQYGYHPCVRQSINFFDDRLLTDEEVQRMFSSISPKGLRIDRHADYGAAASSAISSSFSTEQHCSLFQFFKLRDAMQMVESYEILHGFRYDAVAKTRCDLCLSSIPKFDIKSSILIDSGNVYPNDCFFMTNRDAAERIIYSCVHNAISPIDSRAMMVVPHGLFLIAIEGSEMQVITYPVIDHVVRQNRLVKYPMLNSPFTMPTQSKL